MSTFEDYDETCRRNREAHVEALAVQRKKALIYSDRQHLDDRLTKAQQEDGSRNKVYFLRESGIGAVKIGTSANVAARVRSIGLGMPHELTLLATMPGAYRVESLVREYFKHARIRGEWFRPVPELLEYISEVESGNYLGAPVVPCMFDAICRTPATHRSFMGCVCARHAEELRRLSRSEESVTNLVTEAST